MMAPTEMVTSLRVLRKLFSILFFYVLFLTLLPQEILGFITYSREELLGIRATSTHQQYNQEYDFPKVDPLFEPPPTTMELTQNNGDAEGADGAASWERLRKWALRSPLPSTLLSIIQSLKNKVDKTRARVAFQRDIRD